MGGPHDERTEPSRSGPERGSLALLAVFLVFVVAAIGAGWGHDRDVERSLHREIDQRLVAVADLKVSDLAQWRNERLGDAALLFRNAAFATSVRRALEAPDDQAAQDDLEAWLAPYGGPHFRYDRVMVLDPLGVPRFAKPHASTAISKPLSECAVDALRLKAPTFQDLYRSDVDGLVHLAVLMPILDPADGDRAVGTLVLRIDPHEHLYPFLASWPTPSQTAETLLVRREGDEVVFLNDLRFQHDAALRLRVPLTRLELPAAQAVLGRTGTFDGVDYRGVTVMAALGAVPDSPWYVVARIDAAEALSPIHERRWMSAIVVGALLVGAAAAVALAQRQQRLRYYQSQASLSDALRESEERLRLALSGTAQGIYDLNVQSGEAIVSAEYATMLGYDPDDFYETNDAWLARLHPDDAETVGAAYRDYVEGRLDEYRVEFRQRTSSGEWKWILALGKLVSRTPDGRPLRMLGTHTDITKRKLAELRAQRVSELYSALSRCNEAIVRSASEAELFPQVCAAAASVSGLAMAWIGLTDEATGRVVPVASAGKGTEYVDGIRISVHEHEAIGQGPVGTAIRTGAPAWSDDFPRDPSTSPWRALGERYGWAAATSLPLRRGGRVVGALTLYAVAADAFSEDARRLLEEMAADIGLALDGFAREAARRDAVAALRDKESRLSESQRIAHIGSWEWEPGGRVTGSEEMCRICGVSPEVTSLEPDALRGLVHPDDWQALVTHVAAAMAGEATGEVVVRALRPDGQTRYVRVRAGRPPDGNAPAHLVGTAQDVTRHEVVEQALQQSEIRYRTIFRASRLPMLLIDPEDGRIADVNAAAAAFYGYAADELRAATVQLFNVLKPDELRAAIAHARESGQQHFQLRHRLASGEERDVEVFTGLVPLDGRRLFLSTVVDVTARNRAEAELRRSVHEKEALLREVHHRVKNNLQVVSSMLRLEAGRSEVPATKAVLGEMQGRILSMALLHEALYRSGSFAEVDLGAYLSKLCVQLVRSTVVQPDAVTLRVEMATIYLDVEQAIPCGLLVNELVSNSLKHGFPEGRRGEISVRLQEVDGASGVQLRVSDTGVGLPADLAERRERSLGLQLVDDLTRQLGGTLDVGPGPGATFTLAFGPKRVANQRLGEGSA